MAYDMMFIAACWGYDTYCGSVKTWSR